MGKKEEVVVATTPVATTPVATTPVEETPQVEEPTIEIKIEVEGDPQEEGESKGAKKSAGDTLKEALTQVEHFGQALSDALQSRGNVVMVRINDEALEHLDMLVEAEITKSRSESAAFLINTGIQANAALFEKIGAITQQIVELREQLRHEVKLAAEES